MAKQFSSIKPGHRAFIAEQRIFFAATAAGTGRVNVSPRGTDLFRVLDEVTVAWVDLTGSGSETAAHLLADGRLTVMFCGFAGAPLILRLYGSGHSLMRGGAGYAALLANAFDGTDPPGARQIVVLDVDLVQTSCGFGVPLFSYEGERDTLGRWARAKGEAGMAAYRREKNASSMDGMPTGLVEGTLTASGGRTG